MPGNKRKYMKPGGAKGDSLSVGIPDDFKGFLCTCCGFEKEAVREMNRLLEEFAEPGEGSERAEDGGGSSEDEDELEKELEALRDRTKNKSRRFRQYKVKARGVILIRASDPKDDPEKILLKMLNSFAEKGEKQGRALSRVLPVQTTCKAFQDIVIKSVSDLISKVFPTVEGTKTYSIEVVKRNSDRELVVVSKITEFVRQNFPAFRTDPKNPNVMVCIEVVASTCFLAVVSNYAKFRKFRLASFVDGEGEGGDGNAKRVKTS